MVKAKNYYQRAADSGYSDATAALKRLSAMPTKK
jgi:TPR repeat protein